MKLVLAAALSGLFVGCSLPTVALAAANPVPCEQMLNNVKAALKDAKLSDADKSKVADLQGKGLERCKADDDAGADAFFTDALKVMGKALKQRLLVAATRAATASRRHHHDDVGPRERRENDE